MKTKLALASGLCLALVAVTYAANLLPSYAPGELPPNLAQAPLIYQMAGVVDPAQFDPETESLKAANQATDAIIQDLLETEIELTELDNRQTTLSTKISELETAQKTNTWNGNCGDLLTDIEGNQYKTVQIGDQCWMQENLKVRKYNDGTAAGAITGQKAPYQNEIYYDGNIAANTTKNICPTGWHVPSITEWRAFPNNTPNRSLLALIFAGHRYNGSWFSAGSYADIWSSTPTGTNAHYVYFSAASMTKNSYDRANSYFSIRCLRD